MNSLLTETVHLLRCPDDGGMLNLSQSDEVTCGQCRRQFKTSIPSFIDLRPARKIETPDKFENRYEQRFFDYYSELFNAPFEIETSPIAWGAEEHLTKSQTARKIRHCREVFALAPQKARVACDISGGAGMYSRALAARSVVVLHCDLDPNNLNYAIRKTREAGIRNILFVRSDFFSFPVAPSSADLMLCFDTLIYGDWMVKSLLETIVLSLSGSGAAIIDFYNRRHRNPFHKPYLLGYTHRECDMLLSELPSIEFERKGFYQEFGGRLPMLIPSTRHIYRIRRKPPK